MMGLRLGDKQYNENLFRSTPWVSGEFWEKIHYLILDEFVILCDQSRLDF